MAQPALSTVDAFKHIHTDETVTLDEKSLHALQETEEEILDDVADFCDRNGLTYELGGGSALGAVRGHGMIPWDDDIDINMPRADYDRFIPMFRKEYGGKYWIHTPQETANYGLLLTRIRRKGTSVKTREDFCNPECGAFIDVFVIENTYDDAFRRGIHGLGCMAYGFLVSCRKFRRDRKELMRLADGTGDARIEKVFRTKIFIGTLIGWRSLDSLVRHGDRWNALCRNNQTRFVTIPTGRKLFRGELYLRDQVCSTVTLPYGKGTKKCPKDTAAYLTRLYGPDYMTPPKEADREAHVFFRPFYLSEDPARTNETVSSPGESGRTE